MRFVNCQRIPQQAKINVFADFATLLFFTAFLIFFAVLDSMNKLLKHCNA